MSSISRVGSSFFDTSHICFTKAWELRLKLSLLSGRLLWLHWRSFRNFGCECAPTGGRPTSFIARILAEEFHKLNMAAEAPGLVKKTPGKDGRMVEVALDRSAHHFFVTTPAEWGIASFAE